MQKFNFRFALLLTVAFTLFSTGCNKDPVPPVEGTPAETYDAKLAHDWFDLFRELTKKNVGFTPPVASRALGYAGVTLYEVLVPGTVNYQSLSSQLTDMPRIELPAANKEIHWAIAANAAMKFVAKNYYANMSETMKLRVDWLEADLEAIYRKETPKDVLERSKAWGERVASTIFEWSKADGGHEGYNKNFPETFLPTVGFGKWLPTAPAFSRALQPFWGNNRTFIPRCAENTQPPVPAAHSEDTTSAFYKDAVVIYNYRQKMTPEQKLIAEYWNDNAGDPGGTPPGHAISITTQVLRNEKFLLVRAAEVYAKIGISVSDAFVSCWKCKYVHSTVRPISYIRKLIDPTWSPLIGTPPFPAYSSGHSTQTAAMATVLTNIFGENYAFTDFSHTARGDIDGRARKFSSFTALANEASDSRLFGGIHFTEDCTEGLKQGAKVGAEANKLQFKK